MTGFKTIQTPLLDIAYLEQGPSDGKPVILLHGWPDSARTWDPVTAALASQGWHTFALYVRGFGPTKFLDPLTRRSGQMTAIAQDAKDFADALGLEKFTLVGHDWGGRAAYQFAANWPERLENLVVASVAYGGDPNQPMSPEQLKAYWYIWYFGTEQARYALQEDRNTVCRYLWETWMPPGNFREEEFAAACPSWENPDWVEITLHSYRYRWWGALADPQYHALEVTQLAVPPIQVPTVVLHGADDGAALAESTEGKESLFAAGYKREVLPGVGHFVPREQPEAVINALMEA